MDKFFETISEFLSDIVYFLTTLFEQVPVLFKAVPQALATGTEITNNLPLVISTFVSSIIAIAVAKVIIGR